MGIYLPVTGTLGYVVCPGAGIAGSQGIPPDFYLLPVNVGLPVPPLLPLCATPHPLQLAGFHVSTPPTCVDECGSFKS